VPVQHFQEARAWLRLGPPAASAPTRAFPRPLRAPRPPRSPPRAGRASLLGPLVGSVSLPAVHSCRGRRTHLEMSPTVLWSQAGTHVSHKGVAALASRAKPRRLRLCSAVPATRDRHGEVRCRPAAKPAEAFFMICTMIFVAKNN
jgi:hypothetical protein